MPAERSVKLKCDGLDGSFQRFAFYCASSVGIDGMTRVL